MARTITQLTVPSEEQTIVMLNGYSADIKFDACYKRWYYDLYLYGEIIAAGIALNADTAPLIGYVKDSLALIDQGNPKEEYEPYSNLCDRLALLEITE